MGRLYNEFKAANYEIIVILGEPVEKAKRYAESLHLPFPVLADPERKVYHQYGLEKSFFLQRTASILIDRSGIIQYIRSVTNPIPWLQETGEVLDLIKSLAGAN